MTSKNPDSLICQSTQSTVVAEFTPSTKRSEHYQSEDALEKDFIKQLQTQSYEYLTITKEEDLKENLRKQLEKLNNYKFSDDGWETFFKNQIANNSQGIEEKTTTIQEDYIKVFYSEKERANKNIYLIDKKSIHNNSLQVINQYATDEEKRANRYDVTVLVNGLPLVHIELKRRGVAIKEAFNQINRYQRESFWAGSGLFEYVQLFVISNGTHTKYYSNTIRNAHLKEEKNKSKQKKQSSHSFEFTNFWADEKNNPINDLVDFAKTFFAKHTLLTIITKYCVFTSDKQLLVMRPYQIVAAEKIINKIECSKNYKKYGSIEAGGYIWHTTGSGKTLTSFKTAQLVSKLPYINKVLFVVDRKDLDYQTMKEYDTFEKGAANSNTSTAKLKQQLENANTNIIITTIQKLATFINQNQQHDIFNAQLALIFDECHRSQFGDMHKAITKKFKKYYLFGFTGTPILTNNTSLSSKGGLKTTKQVFGDELHAYTIVNAIIDKNVLPFKLDYISTIKEAEHIADEKVNDIDRERALSAPKRVTSIVSYIREHFDQKTKRNSSYELKDKRLKGFNSIFAVSSIDMAKKYYLEFQDQLKDLPSDKQLKVATIFSYATNEEEPDGTTSENPENTDQLDKSSRDFLEDVIKNYNQMFDTSYDTSSEKFQNYYKNISQRVKNRDLDILIVVNMFLTGFDATTLNTLWVDKNLRLHGLLQAFSRTNRILNSVKTFGNIVCFRNLEDATNRSLALFGGKCATRIVLLKTYQEYYDGYVENEKPIRGYKSLIEELLQKYPMGKQIIGKENQKEFIRLYNAILKVSNILMTFDEFTGDEKILTDRDFQDYQSRYIDLYHQFRKKSGNEKENINDDLVFEIELIKQVEANIDYILDLIKKYHKDNCKNEEVLSNVNKEIDSSIELRNKRELIEAFINSLGRGSRIDNDWISFVKKEKMAALQHIIKEENLKNDNQETEKFMEDSFRKGAVSEIGTDISDILPPMSRFTKDGARAQKKADVIFRLKEFFNIYYDIAK